MHVTPKNQRAQLPRKGLMETEDMQEGTPALSAAAAAAGAEAGSGATERLSAAAHPGVSPFAATVIASSARASVLRASTRRGGRRCDVTLPPGPREARGMREEEREEWWLPVPDPEYRYMFTGLRERALALDERLQVMAEAMAETYSVEEVTPLGVPGQGDVIVAGRVCCESAKDRLNRTTVMLEGLAAQSLGRRVSLDVSELMRAKVPFSLFPGQSVLVSGVNSSGRTMVARTVCQGVPRPLLRTPVADIRRFHTSETHQGGQPLRVYMAAGPFTTSDNLDYAPLEALILKVLQDTPDILILMGPFVDVQHPMIASGDVRLPIYGETEGETEYTPVTFEEVFATKIAKEFLADLYDQNPTLTTRILLVPSLRDAHHRYVFPQPAFTDTEPVQTEWFDHPIGSLRIPFTTGADARVFCLPNPCVFRVNEVAFAITTTDSLFHINAEAVSGNLTQRLQRAAAHLIEQRSFYPLFPPPDASKGAPQLDLRHLHNWNLPVTPDVLIVPSRLKQFSATLHGCLFINPGQLAKGTAGGSYAQMNVAPMPEKELMAAAENEARHTPEGQAAAEALDPESVPILHQVAKRAEVEIVKL